MKTYLLPENGNFYKANLHCHTTVSDGRLTPEEIKAHYVSNGYSIVAYTDHNVMIDHSDLADEGFLPLMGVELNVGEAKKPDEKYPYRTKTCHFCLIPLEPDNKVQPLWHREGKYLTRNAPNYAHLVKFDENEPDYVRRYSVEGVSEMFKIAREKGFFVTYNHPTWSLETYEQYAYYEGMHAMEIVNYECTVGGTDEYNPKIYDEMLQTGKRLYCVATDDCHGLAGACGGFTMIKADKLEHRAITKALEDGNFYASMGPKIEELYLEGDEVHIKCSPAREIFINYGCRKKAKKKAPEGETLTEAVFKIDPTLYEYFRLTVIDENGKPANTNAYYTADYDIPAPEVKE